MCMCFGALRCCRPSPCSHDMPCTHVSVRAHTLLFLSSPLPPQASRVLLLRHQPANRHLYAEADCNESRWIRCVSGVACGDCSRCKGCNRVVWPCAAAVWCGRAVQPCGAGVDEPAWELVHPRQSPQTALVCLKEPHPSPLFPCTFHARSQFPCMSSCPSRRCGVGGSRRLPWPRR